MRLVISASARRSLMRSNKRDLIADKLHQLAREPDALANNVTRLRNREEFRLRVQDWRVIFMRTDDEIIVREVAPRGSAYED